MFEDKNKNFPTIMEAFVFIAVHDVAMKTFNFRVDG